MWRDDPSAKGIVPRAGQKHGGRKVYLRRVKGRHHRNTLVWTPLTAVATQLQSRAEQGRQRHLAHRQHDLRAHGPKLPVQERPACGELVRLWQDTGLGFVVYKADLQYREGARFGDELEIRTTARVARIPTIRVRTRRHGRVAGSTTTACG